ncbi:benzoate-CoA ligase family protein [Rhizobium rhizogenes]|uniref:Long-chain-fatty-acid-CoA ligase protein n=1 Tax=Rhizobium rhizogenes (strain K84 / ATCC BAA-868) TaxID=311403 RepID=B9JM37_RHIR8|nr:MULTISPECIES: benzoate-CoA ligase family protein [Rhizobium]ACM28751.1 long-chain-fatty-acid-CoA ligase protein [Rhizobium rhizogenes K84]EJK88047.1 benzoate-CoA ligase family [Rhizobium sp. AP16]NTI24423.1 benzoate-CoA ligase family protein [Rhizobium rhizogenes]NTI43743.1 benzoate-CoA ligase family protein [Rhizobium rhizogenes]NTI63718.1 benzoate-CoA ligase family protein [Rhizobium rhizogenes]
MQGLGKVEILGGGPAGLYTAILLRRMLPNVVVRVTEQNPQGATFGFGVVFSDQALEFLKAEDPEIHDLVEPQMERWRNMTLNHPEGQVTLDGVGFTAIGRLNLIEILRKKVQELGVEVRFAHPITSLDKLEGDLIIGADGLNSLVRRSDETVFETTVEHFSAHFAWFGTNKVFDTLTQTFIRTDKGPLNAHHYRFSPTTSTFIVECEPETFEAWGFDAMSEAESARVCSEIFKDVLDGQPLITNRSMWRNFPRLWCDRWFAGNHVILGDAAHTAHFSIGSGTRLAFDDAIALVKALASHGELSDALSAYDAVRRPIARKLVNAANTSASWYETFGEKMAMAPVDFAFDYLMRSGRMDINRARQLAPGFIARYETEKAAKQGVVTDPVGDGLPGELEIGFNRAAHPNCSSILWDNLARNPDKSAIIGPTGSMTYAELIADAARWGNAFRAAGLERGDRIPFFLDDTPTYPAAFFGAVRAGFVPVLLNTMTPIDTLNYYLKDTGARLALSEAALLSRFTGEALVGTALETVVVANGAIRGERQVRAEDFLADQPATLDCSDTGPDDMAFWMYSSGTTGKPKGIVHLHHDMAYTQASFGDNVLKLRSDDIVFSVPKIFFAYGFGNSLTFPFSIGATVLLMPGRPDPVSILAFIEAYRPTVFFGLPTLYTALCRADAVQHRDLSSIRQSMSAAEILSEDVYHAWKALVGYGPTEGLGSTEVLHIYLSNALDDHRLGSAGKCVPGYEVKLVTPEGNPIQPGEEGIMLVRGNSSAPCYWNRPDKTRETMLGDWMWTGDRFVERDGHYYFQGRADDLVKVSGQWVWPLEIERCLNEHPAVHECCLLAQEMEDRRMSLHAVVHLKAGQAGDGTMTKVLQDYVKTTLLPFKYPRAVTYVAELPKTGTGKIDRQAVKSMV